MFIRLLRTVFVVGLSVASLALRPAPSLRVLIFLETECPICQKTTGRVQALATDYAEKVTFEAVYPTETVTHQEVRVFKQEYNFRLPYRLDPSHRLVKRYKVTTTPEVVLLSPTDQVLYQGSVDNQFYKLGKYRPSPTEFYLRDAIEATLNNRPILIPRVTPVGCLMNE